MNGISGALFHGLKVIDAAGFIAAPAAATMLSDFGADVIKIEPPGEGDAFRKVYRIPNLAVSEHNYLWMQVCRNRRALALDLKSSEGQAVLHRLVEGADVLITNYPLPLRPRLGLAWHQIEPLNPRLIYASLTGYGETGPEAEKPGYDATTYWARSGLADLVRPDPDGPPASAANGQGDQPSGGMLFAAIVMGLYKRERTGLGGWVGTSLLANGVWANAMSIQAALVGGEVIYRRPRAEPRNALQNFYRCSDGRWFLLSLIAEEKLWPGFAQLMGLGWALEDPRFSALVERRRHAVELARELDRAFGARDSVAWQSLFDAAGQTVGVIARTADVVHDRQMHAIGALVPGEGIPGTGLTVASPVQIGGQAQVPARAAPSLGQHSDEILREAGYSTHEIDAMRERGIVG